MPNENVHPVFKGLLDSISENKMGKIKAFVTFPNAEAAGLFHVSYIVELPDFRAYSPDYTEENRKTIKKFYGQLADSDCCVVFEFEMPKL